MQETQGGIKQRTRSDRKAISGSGELEKLQWSVHEAKWKEEPDHGRGSGALSSGTAPISAVFLQQGTAPIAMQ